MAGRVEGKRAIVTGAGTGIGRETALTLAAEGAAVAVADLNPRTAEETVSQIVDAGGFACSVQGDVSNDQGSAEIVRIAVERIGGVDILVNCAGIADVMPLLELTEDHVDKMIGVNRKGTLYMPKYAIKHMVGEGHSGAIVNFASLNALRARPNLPVYCATKGAVVALTRSLAVDFAKYGIRANCLCPIITDTAMVRKHYGSMPDGDEKRRRAIADIPLQRLGLPEDHARAVLYLVSDDAAFITGQSLTIDGGATAGTSLD